MKVWEYTYLNFETHEMQAELNFLGRDGWELVSVVTYLIYYTGDGGPDQAFRAYFKRPKGNSHD